MSWADAVVVRILFAIIRIVGKDLDPQIRNELDMIKTAISAANRS